MGCHRNPIEKLSALHGVASFALGILHKHYSAALVVSISRVNRYWLLLSVYSPYNWQLCLKNSKLWSAHSPYKRSRKPYHSESCEMFLMMWQSLTHSFLKYTVTNGQPFLPRGLKNVRKESLLCTTLGSTRQSLRLVFFLTRKLDSSLKSQNIELQIRNCFTA